MSIYDVAVTTPTTNFTMIHAQLFQWSCWQMGRQWGRI